MSYYSVSLCQHLKYLRTGLCTFSPHVPPLLLTTWSFKDLVRVYKSCFRTLKGNALASESHLEVWPIRCHLEVRIYWLVGHSGILFGWQIIKIWTSSLLSPSVGYLLLLRGMHALCEVSFLFPHLYGFHALNLGHKVCIANHLVKSVYLSLC